MSGRTILPGTFDGVHLGHRFLINKAKEIAGNTSITVLTFNPHPLFIVSGIKGDFLLTTYEEREELLSSAGVEEVIALSFDDFLRNKSPESFFKEILLEKLLAKKVVVGEDFRFGRNREGDVNLLLRLASLNNIDVSIVPQLRIGEKVVKSEEIRRLLKGGNVREAAILLGRPYSLKGRVIKGEGLGKKLGFPTANLDIPKEKLKPKSGVYAVRVRVNGSLFCGICYVGRRPTISSSGETVCEVHLFDENRDFLGFSMEVYFIDMVREEMKFPSLEKLSKQIQEDILKVKSVLIQSADIM